MIEINDCMNCGACCGGPVGGLGTHPTLMLGIHAACEKLVHTGEGAYACSIYEQRPEICHVLVESQADGNRYCDEMHLITFLTERPRA
jgi:Fe-S-cluster containining protein